jgi:hypothetical protein
MVGRCGYGDHEKRQKAQPMKRSFQVFALAYAMLCPWLGTAAAADVPDRRPNILYGPAEDAPKNKKGRRP